MRLFLVFLISLLLFACQPVQPLHNTQSFLESKNLTQNPTPQHYSICHNTNCFKQVDISLKPEEWNQVRALFTNVENAAEERDAIAKSIGLLETFAGQQSLVYLDHAKNNHTYGEKGQQDCVDESTNSTVYLLLLKNDDLLKFHDVYQPVFRTIFMMVGQHYAAAIREMQTDEIYVVDSWFEANGQPAHIIPHTDWLLGASP